MIPFYEISGESKCVQTKDRFMVASGLGLEWRVTAYGHEVSSGKDGSVLKLVCGDDHTIP